MRLTPRGVARLALVAILLGPGSAGAGKKQCDAPVPDSDAKVATVYEVAEWGFLRGKKDKPQSRQATATLVGKLQAGAAICPSAAACNITVLAFDNVDLTTGYGPVEGDFFVLEQLDNPSDGPELIVREGRLVNAVINLAPALFDGVPVGYLCGEWETTGPKGPQLRGNLSGMFQLPVAPPRVRAFYVVRPALYPGEYCCQDISDEELSLDTYVVRLKLYLWGM